MRRGNEKNYLLSNFIYSEVEKNNKHFFCHHFLRKLRNVHAFGLSVCPFVVIFISILEITGTDKVIRIHNTTYLTEML